MLLEHGLQLVQRRHTRNSVKEQIPHFCLDEWNCPTPVLRQLINPNCSCHAHPNRLGTNFGYKNKEPGSIFTTLHIPFMVNLFRSADAKSGKVV